MSDFWVEDDGSPIVLNKDPIEGTEEVIAGAVFRWTRNELGQLYRRSVGAQVGYHLAPRYTIADYVRQAHKMALEHVDNLSPEIKQAVGREVMMAAAFAPPAPPPREPGPESTAIFI